MQGPVLAQRQQTRTIPVQIQANAILNMSLIELQQFIETESVENPALCIEEGKRCPICGFMTNDKSCPVCGASMSYQEIKEVESDSYDENDYLKKAFEYADTDSVFDPFRTVASTLTLTDYLKGQARMCLAGRKLRIAEYLIDSLDDDGYFRESLFETAEEFATAVPEIEEILRTVQNFEPAGIAARDLRECLLIQLNRLQSSEPVASYAFQILTDHWEDFSKMKLKAIASKIGIGLDVVLEACEFIKESLNPYPATMYQTPFGDLAPANSSAIVPDVLLSKSGETIRINVVDNMGSVLHIDETYDEIYQTIQNGKTYMNEEDCKHIKEHVERVKCILEAIDLRKKTIARVTNFLIEYQREFILKGASYLRPLKQKEVAKELKVHESTISRALAGKYCRLPSGEVISFEVFFDSALPVRNMIKQIILQSAEPLSDSEIMRKLAENGIEIARRTVAKYREQLKLLPYQFRTI